MGFKKEVREFMTLMQRHLLDRAVARAEVRSLERVIERQEKQIQELHDRLLAKDLPQYKEYTLPEQGPEPEGEQYKLEFDENLAGEIVEGEEETAE